MYVVTVAEQTTEYVDALNTQGDLVNEVIVSANVAAIERGFRRAKNKGWKSVTHIITPLGVANLARVREVCGARGYATTVNEDDNTHHVTLTVRF